MKKVLLWIWQLPQNLLGLLVILFTRARFNDISYLDDENFYLSKLCNFGVSLGEYIIIGRRAGWYIHIKTVKHEYGHKKQSRMLGPLYLLVIGLPSLLGNIYSRIFYKSSEWYYKQWQEAWADKLGGVER